MSQVVVYRDESLLFSTNMYTMSLTTVRVPLDYWVCKAGLLIPINQTAPALINFFNGKNTAPMGTESSPHAILVTVTGDIYHVEIKLEQGKSPEEGERFGKLYPTGPGISWVHSIGDVSAGKAEAAMRLAKDMNEVKKLMITADVFNAKQLEFYTMKDLIEKISVIHVKKFPEDWKEKKNAV